MPEHYLMNDEVYALLGTFVWIGIVPYSMKVLFLDVNTNKKKTNSDTQINAL